MSFATSSMLGVDLNNASTTQLFALNQKVTGNDSTEWQYVLATAALATGQAVLINTAGTANILTSLSALVGSGPSGTTGNMDVGFAQFTVAAGSYAFVAKRGYNLYVLCSGTIIPGTGMGFGATGQLVPEASVAVGATALGIAITNTAASTGTASVATAILTYPRYALYATSVLP